MPLQFDIPAVLHQKAPNTHVPAFLVRYLERIAHEKQMNAFLRKYPNLRGYEFIDRVLSEELDVLLPLMARSIFRQTANRLYLSLTIRWAVWTV